jgi:hypothetical protein
MGDLLRSLAITLLNEKVRHTIHPPKTAKELENYVEDKIHDLYDFFYEPDKAHKTIEDLEGRMQWAIKVQGEMTRRIGSVSAEGLWRIIRRLATHDLIGIQFGADPVDAAAHP